MNNFWRHQIKRAVEKARRQMPGKAKRWNPDLHSVARSFWRLDWQFAGLGCLVLGAWLSTAAPRPPWTANRVIGSPNPPAPYTVERVFPKLTFRNPVDLALLPGTDRLFLLEQGGKLYSFPAKAEVERADLVFDFRRNHQPFDASYAIAFHPRFRENGFLFVCYAEPGGRPNGSYVSRFKVNQADPPSIEPDSEKVIIRWLSGGHNGCTLAFGNDGLLYVSTGDAASPDPPDMPYKTGQDISDLLAAILRIDVDRTDGTNAYAIPPDNPFVKRPEARPEVYAFGLRNPWRMSFDPVTGDLWVGDVGWEQWEMIYRVKPGGNYGWPLTEGPNNRVRTDVTPGPGPILPPIAALPHSDAASITGGRVYHGKKLSKLRGAYVYGDWETGKFWALRHEGDKLVSNDELCDTTLKPVSFAEDHAGELLVLDYGGGIYHFVPNTAPPANLAFPRRLSDTGLFADLATLKPSPGVVPYRPNAEMWNDYASAERVLGVPGDAAIITADGRETIAGRMWFFPSNTVFARTLTLEMERGRSASARRIETQLLHFDGQGWAAYTYRWNGGNSDADLVPSEGTNDVFTIADAEAPGGKRELRWRFLSRAECLRCHNAWAGDTLSFNWFQLRPPARKAAAAKPEEEPVVNSAELQRLSDLRVLLVKNARASAPLVNPYDASFDLAERARSWLHVNCAPCHRNGAGGDVPSWFNYDQRIESSRAYDGKPVRGDFEIPGARVITPGDPYRSTLFYRINTEGLGRMPHIGSRLVDEAGVRVLRDWIRSLPPRLSDDPDAIAARKLAEQNTRLLQQLSRQDNRGDALPALLTNMSGCLALLDYATSGSAAGTKLADSLPPSDKDQGLVTSAASITERQRLRDAIASSAAAHTNSLVRDLFERLLPPGQRRQTLGENFDPQTVLALQGSAVRGKEVYLGAAQCSRCHVRDGAGRAYGPDLTEIGGKYPRAQLLEHILHPSTVIAPEYKLLRIELRDESELSGFVLKRTGADLVLRDETLAEHIVKLSDVKESRESALSAMPEGLLAPLTAQEAADLIEYLSVKTTALTR